MAGVDVNVGSISFQATTNDAFFRSMASGTWETQTVHALESLVRPGSRFIDIGAWEGPVTLHAAALGASVEAYEPDPVARERLERNLAANPALARAGDRPRQRAERPQRQRRAGRRTPRR